MSAPSVMHDAARVAALAGEADRLRGLAAEHVARGTDAIEKAIACQHHDHAAARTYVEAERRECDAASALISRAAKLDRESLR